MTSSKFTTEQRIAAFWAKADKSSGPDECWNWTAARSPLGCGRFGWHNHQTRQAHRIAYELTLGAFDAKLEVCHRCDNPSCCNPAHLFLGTHADNMADMGRKKRYSMPGYSGERHPGAKLTDQQVAAIRHLYAAKQGSQRDLARRFGVTQAHISLIVRGETRRTG